MFSDKLVSMQKMIEDAYKNKYAIAQININNLEWIQSVLLASQKNNTPIILGVSMGAAKYIGSYKLIHDMVINLIDDLNITIPVCLHLDHGNYDAVFKAIEAGFSSVMFDGSSLDIETNYKQSLEISKLCSEKNISLELEVGSIGGVEDDIVNEGSKSSVEDCLKFTNNIPMTVFASSFGNIHGVYPKNWKGLDFDHLENISNQTNHPLTLHGGSGIDDEQIKKAISLGVCKINVNTECQMAFSSAIIDYLSKNNDINSKEVYDPRKYLKVAKEAIEETCKTKFELFNSINKA